MYLKSLEMQGFKSFPDKTKLTFERGTTVIVGPNGSGKSNISDAMRWVLGEVSSKSLRGTKMEDVIFGGASSRRQMGFAEVSVTFDNTDQNNRLECEFDEVTVTRRYYRVGESEYFINRRPCRLRDIYELFMNTGIGRDGYSIIGQGKIAEIISRKSEERRNIFEDASGIAKYRHRKTETERKLQTTEENMTRVADIFREVEAQVAPLEKEAERARKAIELHEQKKKVDVQLWLYDSAKIAADIATAETNYRNTGYDMKMADDAIEDYNLRSAQLFEESQSNKAQAAELLDKIQSLTNENHNRESQYQVTETRIQHHQEKIADSEKSLVTRHARLSAEEEEGDRRRAEKEEYRKKYDTLNTEYNEMAEKAQGLANRAMDLAGEIATALADVEERESEATDTRVQMQVIENSKVTDGDKDKSMTEEIAGYRKISEDLEAQCAAKKKSEDEYQRQIDECSEKVAEADEKLGALNARREKLEEAVRDCKMDADLARQRMEAFRAMEEHFEGYLGSVRFVMTAYASGRITARDGSRCGKIYGPLSKVISVDADHTAAIEAALGVNLQHIVVEDENVVKAAIHALKEAQAGRATFFPISSMRGQTPTAEMEEAKRGAGYIGVASDLVSCDDKFRNIVSSLLGRTVVFDNLDHATETARRTKYRVKIVTLDGQIINAGGSFTGGSVKSNSGLLSRSGEINTLKEKLKDLTEELEGYQSELKELAATIETLDNERFDADSRRQLLAALQGSESTALAGLQAKLDANNALIAKLNDDFEALSRQRAGYDDALERLSIREKELRHQIAEISELRAAKDVERNAILDEKTALEQEMTARYIDISAAKKDMETAEHYIADSEARATEIREEIRSIEEGIVALKQAIADERSRQEANRNTFAEGERVLSDLQSRHKLLTDNDMAFEHKLSDINEKLKNKMAERENIFRAHTKNENRLTGLREEQDKLTNRFYEEYEMSRNDALSLGYEPLKPEEREEAAALQVSCRNRLRAIGNVDLDAVNKYKEVKERYDYLAGQIADMTTARDDLQKIIRDLEKEMRTAFLETFNQINLNFNRTFSELFGGGNAELSLSDPEDVLTSGIEIKAAPPGKIIKNLVQLSGGEQSFIAIALFFAILQVNPTPFFILDEIEAALDEVNVARFAAYIKRYSLDTQFILITHRRGTMEAANRLYGVTMPEHGISKVLALDVKSVSGKQEGDDWDGIFSQAT